VGHLYATVVNGTKAASTWSPSTVLLTLPAGWSAARAEYFDEPSNGFLLSVTANQILSAGTQTWGASSRLIFNITYELA